MNPALLTPSRGIISAIFTLAWPTILEQLLQTVVQYADSAMVGQLGATASAAVGITASPMWLVSSFFLAAGIGVLAVTARAIGARDRDRAGRTAVQAIYLTLFLGLVVGGLALLVSDPLPGWMGAEEQVQPVASVYFFIVSLPMVFRGAMVIFGAVLRATGDTRTPMLVNLLVNFINVILNFLLIYETRTLSLFGCSFSMWGAGMGVIGAGIATAIALTVGGIFMTLFLFLCKRGGSPIGYPFRLEKMILKDCIQVALPNAGERLVVCLGQMMFASLIAGLGTVPLAAHSIATTAEEAFYIPGIGFQAAGTTLAGQILGEGNERKLDRLVPWVLLFGVGIMSFISTMLFFFPETLMGFFTRDQAVVESGAQVLRIISLSEPFFALLLVLEGIFHGVGDTKAPFIISFATMWGIRILFTALCVKGFSLGLTAAWCCMAADLVVRACLMFYRYRSGRWKKKLFFFSSLNETTDFPKGSAL